MSLWELAACIDGWNKANGGGEQKPPYPTPEEFDAVKRWHGLD